MPPKGNHKGTWAEHPVSTRTKEWQDREPDTFRAFPNREAYDSWRNGERPPSPPPRSNAAAGSSKGSKGRYVPPAARKRFEARKAKEEGYNTYVENQFIPRPAESWRPDPPPREEVRANRGYSPSRPADGQDIAAPAGPARNSGWDDRPRQEDRVFQRSDRSSSIAAEDNLLNTRRFDEASSRQTRGSTPQPQFTPFLPAPEYVALSRQPARSTPPKVTPKLLVLDLNGTLVYRTSSSASPNPRPYLSSFLQYLFLPDPKDADGVTPERAWEAFVWSSAQPHNVRKMVTAAFGERWIRGIYDVDDGQETIDDRDEGEGRLMGVWSRDKMNLSSVDYSRKVQTVKDLRVLLDHLRETRNPESPEFDESNTVLLDDSPLKAVHQPWSQLIIAEYDNVEYHASKAVAASAAPDQHPPAQHGGLDVTLLAVIGILEELRTVDSVPAWIRAEGLISVGPPGLARASRVNIEDDLTLETLPSHHSFLHWHNNMAIVEHWRQKGLEALQRKGIVAEIGPIAKYDYRSSRSATPQRDSEESWRRRAPHREILSPHGSIILLPLHSDPRPPSPPGPAPAPGPQAELPSGRRNLHSMDSWRTFRAFDVALYLQDVADRPSSLSQIQRQTLHDSIAILKDLGPSAEWEDEHLKGLRGGVWDGELCDQCILSAAAKEKKRLNEVSIKEQRLGLRETRKLMKVGEREAKLATKEKKAEKRQKAIAKRERKEESRKNAALLQANASAMNDQVSDEQAIATLPDIPMDVKPADTSASSLDGHDSASIEAEIRSALSERAICKVLLETMRNSKRGGLQLSGGRPGQNVIRAQLDQVHSRLVRLQLRLGRMGISSAFEISDLPTIAPSDLGYLAQGTLNKNHKRCLHLLKISQEDFLAGRSLKSKPGLAAGEGGLSDPRIFTGPSKRTRNNTASTSNAAPSSPPRERIVTRSQRAAIEAMEATSIPQENNEADEGEGSSKRRRVHEDEEQMEDVLVESLVG